jgi:site-specific DNA-cytosine methylase
MSKNKIRYGSVCSGVEAASLAWKDLGWECKFVSEIEPFPCAVLHQKFGASRPINDCFDKNWNKKNKELPEYDGTGLPNEGDFTKIGKKYEGKIDLLIGGTPCFPKGVCVLTAKGYVPIENIKVGDYVLTDNCRMQKVLRTGNKIANNIVEVKIEGKEPFYVTSNHPFQICDNPNGNIEKREIGLSNDKYVTLLNKENLSLNENNIYNNELKELEQITSLNENECANLIGWYLGCGVHKSLVVNQTVLENFEKIFKRKINYQIEKQFDMCNINLAEKLGDWFINQFGDKEHKIPVWVYGLSKELKENIEVGFLDSRNNPSTFSIFGKELLYGIVDLFGHKSFEKIDTATQLSTNFQFDVFVVNNHKYLSSNDRMFAKIESIKEIKEETIVYNIEVEKDHTYVANGIRVWNCQDASVAGKRAGLVEGSRSRLAFDFVKLAYESRVRWLVWENVPGCFSLNGGKDFAEFLSSFAGWQVTVPEGGWKSAGIVTNATPGNFGLAWRVLDGQYVRTQSFPFAVPQRRRRIFVVGYFGDWRRAAEVLFESQSLYGNPPPCRKARKEIARDVRNCIKRTEQIYGVSGNRNGDGRGSEGCGIETETECNGTKKFGFGADIPLLKRTCFASSGFGQKIESEVASTLSTNHDDRVTGNNAALIMDENEVYSFDSLASNSMKSSNPNSGCHITNVSKTIDTTIPDPSKNQGGMVVVAIDGDKINKKERKGGSGFGINTDGASYTLTAKDVHAVAYEETAKDEMYLIDMMGGKNQSKITNADVSPTLATTHNDCHAICRNETICFEPGIAKREGDDSRFNNNVCSTLRSEMGDNLPAVVVPNENNSQQCFNITFCDANGTRKDRPNGGLYVNQTDASKTLSTNNPNIETVIVNKAIAIDQQGGKGHANYSEDVCVPLCADSHGTPHGVCYSVDRYNQTIEEEVANTVKLPNGGDSVNTILQEDKVVFTKSGKPKSPEDAPTYRNTGVANTLNCFENNSEGRAVELVCERKENTDYAVLAKGNGDAFLSRVHTSVSTGGGEPGQGYPCALTHSTVRRLLPIETERLMGFPDNHTRIKWNGKPEEECVDGPRYKACGNSFCVNAVEWIGERIQMVEDNIEKENENEL